MIVGYYEFFEICRGSIMTIFHGCITKNFTVYALIKSETPTENERRSSQVGGLLAKKAKTKNFFAEGAFCNCEKKKEVQK